MTRFFELKIARHPDVSNTYRHPGEGRDLHQVIVKYQLSTTQ
ncbi:hypothetical protein OCL06_15180 [Alteromonas sp. ASW11-19]|uniref:Uncharacterized protein n=1 Tax=Alteromonas salexigens TaxID=2982530 RepID=A0ABT2VRJ3_9ALTE|nr:hypothetical protein [Alteromonas salexigens]MCU7555931.1 hypothetical protein [Alteromonas salexigens]